MLPNHEPAMSRHQRRALLSGQRTRIQKRAAFGRTIVLAVEHGMGPQDCRVVYLHTTKGVLDGRSRMNSTGPVSGHAVCTKGRARRSLEAEQVYGIL